MNISVCSWSYRLDAARVAEDARASIRLILAERKSAVSGRAVIF